jgi:hypothetical protein
MILQKSSSSPEHDILSSVGYANKAIQIGDCLAEYRSQSLLDSALIPTGTAALLLRPILKTTQESLDPVVSNRLIGSGYISESRSVAPPGNTWNAGGAADHIIVYLE